MNHFEFYDLPVQFYLDEGSLKKKFYELSRKHHPDQHTLAPAEVQAENLRQSSQNNEAYKTLKDFFKRFKYVLSLRGTLAEDSRNEKLPQDFLMEMMDINEEVMDVQMQDDPDKKQKLLQTIFEMERNMFTEIRPALVKHDANTEEDHDLSAAKEFYLKRQYLQRIQANLK